jgi:hypothetical protein
MNSDPHENAAWRSFGMLDSDEAAAFDEAMRHDPVLKGACREMDRLATSIAVTTAPPLAPRAGQLERLHLRLGLYPRKRPNWVAISGWGVAAALAMLMALDHFPSRKVTTGALENSVIAGSTEKPPEVNREVLVEDDYEAPGSESPNGHDPATVVQNGDGKAYVKVETKRLIQEIEVLREKLENFQILDRKRFDVVPGMAWPVVMRMAPPGTAGKAVDTIAMNADEPTITAMIGDAMSSRRSPFAGASVSVENADFVQSVAQPAAIPIYDAARDTGTLVVSHLPAKGNDENFNLWVMTANAKSPVYVGRLPDSENPDADSFDFSLGSTMVVPTAFLLTKDKQDAAAIPSETNTVLQGPY